MPSPFVFQVSHDLANFSGRLDEARVRNAANRHPSGQAFADVPPGSQGHRYAELLARAGISAGCGDGNFCPNDPVTRGQLAVLLAKALGLWPN